METYVLYQEFYMFYLFNSQSGYYYTHFTDKEIEAQAA